MEEGTRNNLENFGDLTNITRILVESKKAIKEDNWMKLKELSNQTIHSALVYQDSINLVIAVLIYASSKIFQREGYKKMEGWNEFYDSFMKSLNLMIDYAKNNDYDKTLEEAGEIRHNLTKISGNLGEYIADVFRKAEINKAFKLYEHGLSSAQTAKLLGVSLWDMASYIGQSKIHESKIGSTMPIEERIKMAEDFFK